MLMFILVHVITAKRFPFYLPKGKIAVNLLCYWIVFNGLFVLTARMNWACIAASFLLILLATANYYVFRFKGTELAVTDFLAIGTAKNVAGHYHYKPEARVIAVWGIWFLYAFMEGILRICSMRNLLLVRGIALVIEAVLILMFLAGTKTVRGTHWENQGSLNYGFLLNFLLGLKSILGLKPKGYQLSAVSKLAKRFQQDDHVQAGERSPDVIVIMNESFADLGVLGKAPETNVPVLPVFHSIENNSIKGYALSSVFGGTTANSEYEFLTGNSMAFFPYGSIPYMQFIHGEAYSLVSEMKRQGYYCMATHPYLASGWSRPTVYPAFGFDKITFEEAYPKKDAPRGYISDDEMYDYVTEQYDAISKNGKVFLFGVTVQNHGDYANRSEMVDNTVFLKDRAGQYPDAEQYLSLLRRSDQSLEKLISYFSKVDRDVVLCFFGDHLPSLDPAFLRNLHGGGFQTLDERQQTRKVPFFIWANYPIQKKSVDCTSLNYLANWLLDAAGLPCSPYRNYLKELEREIPSINADGYYSKENGCFQPVQQAQGQEAEMLRDYGILVYNNAIDRSHRNQDFFPGQNGKKA